MERVEIYENTWENRVISFFPHDKFMVSCVSCFYDAFPKKKENEMKKGEKKNNTR